MLQKVEEPLKLETHFCVNTGFKKRPNYRKSKKRLSSSVNLDILFVRKCLLRFEHLKLNPTAIATT